MTRMKEIDCSESASSPPPRLKVHIRWMIRRDMDEVLEIERNSFQFPWFQEEFIRCLRQRNCLGMVAELPKEDRIVGFYIYELYKTRIHILNLAVAPGSLRRGVATQIVEHSLRKLSSMRRTRISLEIRETNLAAQLFFRSFGFKATSVLRDFYDDSPEDAYLFQYCLPEA